MINSLYSTNTLYIVIVYTLCIVITIFHIQWMCNPVRIYGNKLMNEWVRITVHLWLIKYHTMNTCGSGGTAPLVHNHSTRWMWVVNLMPLVLHTWRKSLSIHCWRRLISLRVSLDKVVVMKHVHCLRLSELWRSYGRWPCCWVNGSSAGSSSPRRLIDLEWRHNSCLKWQPVAQQHSITSQKTWSFNSCLWEKMNLICVQLVAQLLCPLRYQTSHSFKVSVALPGHSLRYRILLWMVVNCTGVSDVQ